MGRKLPFVFKWDLPKNFSRWGKQFVTKTALVFCAEVVHGVALISADLGGGT